MKIVFAPVILLIWIICTISKALLQITTFLSSILAILFIISGIVSVLYGNVGYGIAGVAVGFAVSPYGIPKLAALLLARLYYLRYWLTGIVFETKK